MNKSNRFLFLTAVWINLAASQAYGAPTISSVTGTFADNASIAINGSGFGTKSPATPNLWDTVDNIAGYSGLTNGATIPTGGIYPWSENSALHPGAVKYNRSDAQRTPTGLAQYKASGVGGTLEGRTVSSGNLYVSWWWKPASSFSSGDHSSKILRVGASSNYVNNTFSWTQQQSLVYSTSAGYCANNWHGWSGDTNSWNFMEVWFNNSARTYSIKVNGVTAVNNASFAGCSFNLNHVWMIGFDGGGNSPLSLTWWMDDIYVDNSLARVMLGNKSTFLGSTVFEMQKPTAWSNSSVSITANPASFSTGQTVFLYVVDPTGAVNATGYQITLGAPGGGIGTPSGLHLLTPDP